VPNHLVPLAKQIAKEVCKPSNREIARGIREVFMQFDDTTDVPLYSLYAIVLRPEEIEAVRDWLADIARAIPTALGVADVIEAATADGTSFGIFEDSYAADVKQMTWRGGQPEVDGAT
jgi:hypothetical protein